MLWPLVCLRKAVMPPFLLLHATLPCTSVACAHVLAVYSWCSPAMWLPCIPFRRMLLCTLLGARFAPSNWLHPSGAYSVPASGGTLATREQTSPRWRGGSGALAFPPSVAWSYGPPHRPNGTQPGACCHPTFLNCLEKMLGTVSWYMLPTKSSTSHLASTKVLHGHSPFHAPNRRGRPSGQKHQEGLVFPS